VSVRVLGSCPFQERITHTGFVSKKALQIYGARSLLQIQIYGARFLLQIKSMQLGLFCKYSPTRGIGDGGARETAEEGMSGKICGLMTACAY